MRSHVALYAHETVQLLWLEILDFICTDLCPPSSPVDYRISGLMQRVYIVQTPVRDTSRCDQRLEAAPHYTLASISQNVVDEAVGQRRKRLRASTRQKDITLMNIC